MTPTRLSKFTGQDYTALPLDKRRIVHVDIDRLRNAQKQGNIKDQRWQYKETRNTNTEELKLHESIVNIVLFDKNHSLIESHIGWRKEMLAVYIP